MTATVSPAIAALFDQAANLTVEDALALAAQYKGQFFFRSAMKKGERPGVTTDHGRLVTKARHEAEKALPSSQASTLARARVVQKAQPVMTVHGVVVPQYTRHVEIRLIVANEHYNGSYTLNWGYNGPICRTGPQPI